MKLSKRHHFIPEFHLKNFTNEKGKFYIYLTKQDRFKGNDRLFSPKQQFYGNFANRTLIGKNESVFIESEYSKLDTKVGSILHKCKSDAKYKITEYEWLTLQHFVDIMFWRNPSNEGLLKEKIRNAKSLSELGLSNAKRILRPGNSEYENWDINQFNSDEGIYKYIRLLMPMTNEITSKAPSMVYLLRHNYKNIFGKDIPKLIGDNPVIYRSLHISNLHNEQFIFPFTPTLFLIRTNVQDLAIWKEIRLMIDMLQIVQAKEYVAVTNLKYPNLLREFYEKTFTSINHLRQSIFDHIFEKSEIQLEKDILYDSTCWH